MLIVWSYRSPHIVYTIQLGMVIISMHVVQSLLNMCLLVSILVATPNHVSLKYRWVIESSDQARDLYFDHKYMPWDLNNYYHGNNMHGCPNIVVAIWMNKHNYECLWLSYSPKVICIWKGVAYLCMQPNCTYQCTVTISFSMALVLLCYMVVIMGHIDIRAPNIYFVIVW